MQYLNRVFQHREPLIEHRCHGGHVVAETYDIESTLRNPDIPCPICGEVVHVDAYHEWVDMTPEMRRDVWLGVAMVTPVGGGALGVLLGAGVLLAGALLDAPDALLLPMFWTGLAAGLVWPTILATLKIRASRIRTAARLISPLPPQ